MKMETGPGLEPRTPIWRIGALPIELSRLAPRPHLHNHPIFTQPIRPLRWAHSNLESPFWGDSLLGVLLCLGFYQPTGCALFIRNDFSFYFEVLWKAFLLDANGDGTGARTWDLRFSAPVLYRLSYPASLLDPIFIIIRYLHNPYDLWGGLIRT